MDRVQVVRKVVWGGGGLYDYSLLRWQESWMSGATNLTLSLTDRTQLPWESGRWVKERERGEDGEPAPHPPTPLFFLVLFFFPIRLADCTVAADDFWALSSCWQHPVYQVAYTNTVKTHTHTHTEADPHISHSGLLAAPHLRTSNLLLLLLPSTLCLLWCGFILLSKSRHSKLCSHPTLLLLLAPVLIPGQTTSAVFTMAFDGAALSFMFAAPVCVCVCVHEAWNVYSPN